MENIYQNKVINRKKSEQGRGSVLKDFANGVKEKMGSNIHTDK
jgi:hypothetical protein